jgi:hypothetical protein
MSDFDSLCPAANPCTPVLRGIRAYFAPVDRTGTAPVAFDATALGRFDLDSPPAPWVDLGWVDDFSRKCASRVGVLAQGSPANTAMQLREMSDATVKLRFLHWGKLQMALASGAEHWNLLKSGTAATLTAGSTATKLAMSADDAGNFSPGQTVVVDVDYCGQTGYVGSGAKGAHVAKAASINGDADFIRRVSLNVARVLTSDPSGLQLAVPLLAGAPGDAMKVQTITGFMDREGGTFFQEWSALFVVQAEEGERVLYNYPRLQAMTGAGELMNPLAGSLQRISLTAEFRALPVLDGRDGQQVLCYRSFLPAAGLPL